MIKILLIIVIIMWLIACFGWFVEHRIRNKEMLYLSQTFDELAQKQKKARETESKDAEKRFFRGAELALKMAKDYIDYEIQN